MQESRGNGTLVYEEHPTTRAVKLTLYAVIFMTGLVGNVLVCLVVCRQRRLKTSTNYFILNLACADLGVIVFCIPLDVVIQENGYRWPFGDFLCRIIYPLMTVLTFASVGTLIGIAMNRHHAILTPMRIQAAGKRRAKVAIVSVWLLSIALSLPYAATLKFDETSLQCEETWSEASSRFYTVFLSIFQYCLPLLVITAAYIRIGIQLRRNRANMTAAHRVQDRDVRKVVRMMIVVVLLFALCMLPNQILWTLKYFHSLVPMHDELLSWGAILIYANSCSNPIVYSICAEEFRTAFKAYIFKCHRVKDEDLAPLGRLLGRLSSRSSARFSSLNNWLQLRASHTNGTKKHQEPIPTLNHNPVASEKKLSQPGNGTTTEGKTTQSEIPPRTSGRTNKKQGVKVTVV